MTVKRVKAGQDFTVIDLAANEGFKNFIARRARELPLDAIVGVGLVHRFAATLHLRGADPRFRLSDDGHRSLSQFYRGRMLAKKPLMNANLPCVTVGNRTFTLSRVG
jgi:hypothetical protein